MSKYNAVKTTIDGITFDSKKEANRYSELKLLERAGKITDLKLQPEYVLFAAKQVNGHKLRAIKYIADFEYFSKKSGSLVVEDVKGVKTAVYKLKKNLFERIYGMRITEI